MTLLQRAWRGARNDVRLYLLSVFSVAVAFICLGASLLTVFNVQALKNRWENTGRLSVYLKTGSLPEEIQSIKEALTRTTGVASIRYVTAKEARTELSETTRDPLFDSLADEAFPDSLEVALADGPTRVEKVALQLSALPAVESVETYTSWAGRLGELIAGGITATALLSIVIFGAVIAVVSSTVRLSLERRRMEIDALRLVGATGAYVRQPFVIEGAALGALGAAAAIVLLACLFGVVSQHFAAELGTLLGISPAFLPGWSILAMVVGGAVLGALAAVGSLRKLSVI